MKLRDFVPVEAEAPPIDIYVLGYWEGEPQPFMVVRMIDPANRPCFGTVWQNLESDEGYRAPTSWHHLPGGKALNDVNHIGEAEPDLDA